MRSKRRDAGFTLVELMITVAIIGILSGTAITLFRDQQMRSKRSEAMTNVEGVAKMTKGYFGDTGVYPTDLLYYPPNPFGPLAVPWNSAGSTSFDVIGFRAEGAVRYRYDLIAGADCGCVGCFTAAAYTDLDGDGPASAVAYFHPPSPGLPCATGFGAFGPNLRGGTPILDETHALVAADQY